MNNAGSGTGVERDLSVSGGPTSIAVAAPGQRHDLCLASYDYRLPPGAIAQRPALRRDMARLMVVNPRGGAVKHTWFGKLGQFFRNGDVLVVNDSKVVPARLRGHKRSGGAVELLLVEQTGQGRWSALVRSNRRLQLGTTLEFGGGLQAVCLGAENGRVDVRLAAEGDLDAVLARVAELPLPPYIRRPSGPDDADRERYQTVYASAPGSIAAPTAGLHFTEALMEQLAARGIGIAPVTLQVGPATFQPIRTEDVAQHDLEGERYEIPHQTVEAIAAARRDGGRVIAVGTTTTRALEAAAGPDGQLRAGSGVARIFIRPGHQFRVIDGLITNFHLPRSSLLVLVAGFVGRDVVLRAYAEAVAHGYRFYSYGDAMLALRDVEPMNNPG
jgi:S-adenosylmethionine:tRNA ribosyltransferase-isomerase